MKWKASFIPLAVFMFAAPPALAQQLGGGESPDISIWRILLALILSLLVALGVIWFFYQRQRGGSSMNLSALPWLSKLGLPMNAAPERAIEIVDMRKLNQQTDVCLLRCQSREYFILLGSDGPVILREQKSSVSPTAASDAGGDAGGDAEKVVH